MYPGTIINWFDQSSILTGNTITELDNSPLFMVVGSFDKGPEDLREVRGKEFNSLYGNKMSFARHGQNAIQTQRIIDAGGRVLIKRVCADDATLANLIAVANVTTETAQKTDIDGNLIYVDGAGDETTDSDNSAAVAADPSISLVSYDPVMETTAKVKWEAKHITDCKTFAELKTRALTLLDEANGVYPLFVFAENGRGVSGKAVRLIPDYNTSKGIGTTFYTTAVFEGTTSVESTPVTIDPDVIYGNVSYGLSENRTVQVKSDIITAAFDAYLTKIASAIGMTEDEARNNDLVYGYTHKGSALAGFSLDLTSVDFNASYGIELKGGSNGTFGSAPVNTPAWVEAIRKVYAGEITDEVWDVDQHKISAVVDANFPQEVKDVISEFVTFRKDCVFFRDLGTDLNTFIQIKTAYLRNEIKNYFIADYATSYEVKDPATGKNIKVTMMYDFVECLVNHLATSPYNPLAGVVNGFILKEAIKGTINYTPIVTPTVNQKQAMDDIRVNYAIFNDDNCVVQTLYTSQEPWTELSYANAVIGIQVVARAIRTACPKQRYSLVTGKDMSAYAKAVENVLSAYRANFAKLEFEYLKDDIYASQKIFYASIRFAFHSWAQTEIFDLFAINNND